MQRELACVEPWQARIEARSPALLKREVARAFRRGELAAVGPMRPVEGGYAVEVWRLKPHRAVHAWRRPVLVAGGAVVVLGGAAALGWWLVAPVAPVALVALLFLGLLRVTTGRRSGCTTTVTITHRR